MKRLHLIFWYLFLEVNLFGQVPSAQSRLIVSKDRHELQYDDGRPFFWLGDTAWELFSKLTLEEIKAYLDNRAAKGFNVIQVVALSGYDISTPNRYGEIAFHDLNPLTPNEKYFSLIDNVLQLALERQLTLAIIATWGDKVVRLPESGTGPLFNKTNAYPYGKWLGERYKKFPNIVWVMGGDVPGVKDTSDYRPVWREMARGIIEATGDRCLITYHPNGERSSSQWMQAETWMDFNMIQSSHGRRNAPVWDMIRRDRALKPVMPVLDSEPNYEDHPVNPWPTWKSDSGYFREYDVRKQLYRAVFSGGCGVTYGHHAVWQFVSEREEIINYADRGWIKAMDRPGAFQAGHLRKLMESRPLPQRTADETIIIEGQGEKGYRMEAFRGAGDSFAMIYLPVGKKIAVSPASLKSKTIVAWWFNPKDASVKKIGVMSKIPRMEFTPPATGIGNDWVLILDDPSKNYPTPGQ